MSTGMKQNQTAIQETPCCNAATLTRRAMSTHREQKLWRQVPRRQLQKLLLLLLLQLLLLMSPPPMAAEL
jgi:hypothetical protein